MLRALPLVIISVVLLSCQSSTTTNSMAGNSANSNANNLPPEFSTVPITPSTDTTPGIPANGVNTVPKGTTPTPGIPPPSTINKRQRPGATPTPGIPDQETIRRQMQGQGTPNPTPGDNQMRPMKKKTPQPN
jgi:hypothetical protein